MTGDKRLLSLIAVLLAVSLVIIVVTLTLLYDSAFEQQQARLIDMVKSQASLIKAVARYDQHAGAGIFSENPTYDAFEATLSQLRAAHEHFGGLGKTGEFTLATRELDQIVFLLHRRHHYYDELQPIAFSSAYAEPMRRALSGKSGVITGLDYRGEKVLAAYEPVAELGLGIVAKIDLTEIRAPFIRTGFVSVGISVFLIIIGGMVSFRIGNPIVRKLIENEARLWDITSTIPGCVYQFILHEDSSISIPYMSDAIDRIAGIKASILMENATKLYDYIHIDDRVAFNESIARSAKAMTQWKHSFRIVTTDRGTIWIDGSANPRRLPDDSILWNGVLTDITNSKHGELELKRSKLELNLIYENAPLVMILIDHNRRIKKMNAMAASLSMLAAEECVGLRCGDALNCVNANIDPRGCGFSPACLACDLLKIVKSAIQPGEAHRHSEASIKYNHPDCPTEKHFLVSATPLRFSEEELVLVCLEDITELKRLQSLESRAERLETAGIIAGQVAHDFNNLLGPLMAYPEFIREELPVSHPALEYLDQIELAAQKIADINQDLLTMGRRGHYNQEALNLNTIVEQALAELKPFPNTLEVKADFCNDLMHVFGGGAQLYRMVSNLLHNARDAMQGVGEITVWTENYYSDKVLISNDQVPMGEFVKLTISDTGCGMSNDIVQKIFDPFFSSKKINKERGSGLGMSVVAAVVKDHHGYIDLRTEVGVGTSFYIYLPITRESRNNQELGNICGGTEKLLVVDDDDVQRQVTSRILSRLGYKTSTVENGEGAIQFIQKNPQDIIILDMLMPGGIDGAETYRQILEIYPGQKALILSGYSESDRVTEALNLGVGALIKKPVKRSDLAAAVRLELDRRVEVVAS